MPDLNPVAVEQRIWDASNRIARGLPEMDKRFQAWKTAQRVFDQARAKAFLEASGSIPERNAQVELATVDARRDLDVAEAAWLYANRQFRALQAELDAMRSIGASVRQAYSAQS